MSAENPAPSGVVFLKILILYYKYAIILHYRANWRMTESERSIDSGSRLQHRRLSLRQADEICRLKDGLEEGQTIYDSSLDKAVEAHDPSLNSFSIYELTERTYGEIDEFDSFYDDDWKEKRDALSSSLDHFTYAGDVSSVLTSVLEKEKLTESEKVLTEIIEEYLLEHPEADFDADSVGSYGEVMRFAAFYKDKLGELLGFNDLADTIQGFRQDLIDSIDKTMLRKMVKKSRKDTIKESFAATPIVILDPLNQLIKDVTTGQNNASFSPEKRVSYINPYAIKENVIVGYATPIHDGAEGTEITVKNRIKASVYHELWHSVTSKWYSEMTLNDDDLEEENEGELKVRRIWPAYFNEGMVQKLTFMCLTASKDLSQNRHVLPQYNDSVIRFLNSDEPKTLLETRHAAKQHRYIDSSYVANRLVIDTLFDKLDWQAAGVTWQDAQSMLVAAFLDVPDDTSKEGENCPDLKKFIQTVNKAGHRGILHKIGTLVDFVGEGKVLDILEDSQFNPHDPSQIPWFASFARMGNIVNDVKRLQERQEILASLEKHRAPEYIIAKQRNMVEAALGAQAMLSGFATAHNALSQLLANRHGTRQRMVSGQQIIMLPFGKKIMPKSKPTFDASMTAQDAETIIQDWRKEYESYYVGQADKQT